MDQVKRFLARRYIGLKFASFLHLLTFFAFILLEFVFDLVLPLLATLKNCRCWSVLSRNSPFFRYQIWLKGTALHFLNWLFTWNLLDFSLFSLLASFCCLIKVIVHRRAAFHNSRLIPGCSDLARFFRCFHALLTWVELLACLWKIFLELVFHHNSLSALSRHLFTIFVNLWFEY